MPGHSPSRSRTDYTWYEFTASSGFDYNYDPVGGRTSFQSTETFDPYTDDYPNSPVEYNNTFRDFDRSYQYDGYKETRQKYLAAPAVDITNFQKPPETSPPAPPLKLTSEAYIRESEGPSNRIDNPSSSRKLLILDLNGTLLFRSPHVRREYRPRQRWNHKNSPQVQHPLPDSDPYADPMTPRPLRSVHPRPYLASFRQYLFHPSTIEWLDTMVWSSAQPHSVADMVEKCFGEKKDRLVAIWARDTLGLEEKDYYRKTQTTKDLEKPWAALSSDPTTASASNTASQVHSARTTLLLDDSPLKAHLQPWNHLCIREYVAELRNADLALHALEKSQLEAEAHKTSETPQPEVTKQSDNVATAQTEEEETEASTLDGDPEVEVSNKKKRKRQKKKKAVKDTGLAYDQTLLAVIGVLDDIKYESSVAGWMRSGRLHLCRETPRKQREKEDMPGSDDTDVDSDHTHGEHKRRRFSSKQDGGSVIKPAQLPPATIESSESPLIPSSVSYRASFTPTAPGDTSQWYQNTSTMAYWVRRGIDALDELRIEIISGIES